ncbi:MAG: glycosyltransferase [Rhodocyclaceae bacterium]|nr:glycosyltransferase [Rhodocyclaceae bacterium]
MNSAASRIPVRLHLTNVVGAGASQLLQSLLPALERDPGVKVERIDLPDRGALSAYRSPNLSTVVEIYRRRLPNALSRVLECTWLAGRFDGDSPLLVLGDLPLRCHEPQTVFVQQSNLLRPDRFQWRPGVLKYWLARTIFSLNRNRVRAFIVQTNLMRDALERSYPSVAGRVHVIAQPVPSWLLRCDLRRRARAQPDGDRLWLIYPAAGYPHKNHALLSRLDADADWPVEQLTLTLDAAAHPAPHLPWVKCLGFLSPHDMITAYARADALLFLSKEESYGFPLVEAMFVGLPIVCPDLPYAHTLCGDQAIYFDPASSESLLDALRTLQTRLREGWWPYWDECLVKIPRDWETVARRMLEVVCSS